MTSASFLSRAFNRFSPRTFLAAIATLLWIQAAPTLRAEIINYTPSIKTAAVLSPDILVYPIVVTSPANTPSGPVTTVSFTTSSTGAPVDLGTALTFFTVSPSTLDFTGPGQKKTILARLAVPAGTTPGVFVYKVKTLGFPTAGNVDLGSTLNASVSEAPPDIDPPTVTIVTPPDLTVYTPLASEMPLTIPFSFTAAASLDHPVLSVDASVAGTAIIPLSSSVDLLGVTTAVGSIVVTNPGTYTIQARATNEGGTSEVSSKFTVNVIAPKPTVAITAPAANAVFTFNAGTTPPPIQFNFTADSTFGVIRQLTADLNGVPVVFTSSGLNTLHASGTTTDLALSVSGLYTLHVTAQSDYGTAETTSQFTVNVIYPTPSVVVDAPADGSTVALAPGALTGNVSFQFTTSTTPGFNVSGTTAVFDNGAPFTPNTSGLGSVTAISSGALPNVGPGPHTLTVTGVSAGISVSATSKFNVVLTGTPPAITSADHTTFTYAQAGTFTVTGTGLPLPTFTVTGALPAGVTFNGTAFVGTPTVTGDFPLTITATNGINPSATQAFTLSVVKATATITVTNSSYVYNATTRTATVTAPAGVPFAVTYNNQSGAPSDVGVYNVVATITDPNYSAQPATGTLTITAAPLTVIGTVANNKVYDGSANATLANVGTLSGVIGSDNVTLNASAVAASFANKTAGLNKLVTIAGLTLGGTKAGNYTLTQPSALANITAAPLTISGVTANNKTYDRTTAATLGGVATATLNGKVAGDAVTLNTAGATGTFTAPDAGANKPVVISGFTLSGNDAGNYTLVQPAAQASITAKALGVTASPVKDYDGTTAATLNSGNSTLSGVIAGDTVALNFSNVTATYNTKDVGTNKPVAVTGLALAGALAANYAIGTITAAGEIRPATPVITWPNPAPIVYGTKLSATQLNATANVPGTFVYAPALGALLDAGNQTLAVTFTPTDTLNYKTLSTTRPLVVTKANQIITFNALPTKTVGDAPFTISATVDTNNPITFSSDTTTVATVSGTTVTVVGAGTAVITASVAETNNYYAASATQPLTVQPGATRGTALVRHSITLNGLAGIDGSIQVLLPEGDTLNGNAFISGSLLVPGLPTIVANGHPTYVVADGTGAATPTNYNVTLNGNALIGKIVRRTDAVQMPVVAPPPSPKGTRSVTLNSSKDTVGTWSTVKNLTLNGNNLPTVVVPAGTYGNFVANGNKTAFQLGTPGSSTPAVYNFQNLTLNGNSALVIAGPVVITLANGMAFNGDVGTDGHPEWLTLKIASGGLTLNGNIDFSGFVVAPSGSVILNGNDNFIGGVVCDQLTINGNGLLELVR